MKNRSIWILALLAAASGAQAQSGVTLYALLDVNISKYGAGNRSGTGDVWRMQDGTTNGLNGSRWGIRGVRDLGNGLSAMAVGEAGVLADNGNLAQGGRGFGRQVFVSLAQAGVGDVRLGRQYVLSDSVMGLANPFGNALVNNPGTGVTNVGRALPMWLNAPRADNVVQLASANWGGFTGALQVAPGEATVDRFHGVRAGYAIGGFNVAASYEWNVKRIGGDRSNESITVGANYNFGVLKLMGGLQRNSKLATGSGNGAASGVSNLIVTGASTLTMSDLDGWTLGAEVPIGKAFTLGVNGTSVKYSAPTGANLTLGKLALDGRYALFDNTFLYAGVSVATGDLKEYIAEKTVVQAGMRISF